MAQPEKNATPQAAAHMHLFMILLLGERLE